MEDFDIDFNFNFENEDITPENKKTKKEFTKSKERASCYKRQTLQIYRRAYSEVKLLDLVDKFEEGYTYNFITAGDIDALSYLKLILRHQNLEYLLFSTWCMAMEDIYQLQDFLNEGKIKKIDAYVGEIFPNSYRKEYNLLKEVLKICGGKVVVFKNHSKIFAGYGDKFYFGVQSSANINTNPRTENGSITIDKGIYEFYKEYYDGINSFEKE